jgi:two-component system chemotaxis sensor kinase CheA
VKVVDEEILQDFLAEASDLIDQLNGQLAELGHSPDDADLLNAVFRGFHTIKGGAGFLAINPLIEVCHRAENVFDKIRNGDLVYDAVVEDVILRAFDVISDVMDLLKDGVREMPENDPELLINLDALTAKVQPVIEPSEKISEPKLQLADDLDPDGDMSDDEFEALLNQRDMMGSGQPEKDASMPEHSLSLPEGVDPDGEISDDEFEALLSQRDMLEGGESAPVKMPEAVVESKNVTKAPSKKTPPVKAEPKPVAKNTAETTVRVDTRRLDEIMNLVGELVLVRNRLLTLKGANDGGEALANAVSNLDHVTTDLQSSVMKTRMQPVKKVFGRFPRVVRDLARKLGKEINLEMEGEETDLDKNLVEALADPLVHLVRNSVDHGIEMPDVRVAAGKPRDGTVVLAAEQEGDHILLSITDDGKGMDPDMLRRKAVEKGMMDEMAASQLDDKSAFELILAAGFSTAEAVSDISGRGVGMDVVKNMITKLNGSIDIHSVLGQGTKINIRVPLTLAVLPTLMVGFNDDSYAIPLTSVQEIFDYNPEKTNRIDGQMMVRLRGRSIPLFFLNKWLAPHQTKESQESDKVVIVSVGNQRVGLVVNQVNGQEEVVIKPLGVMLKKVRGYAGATITGNGSIALILDLPGVVERFQH